MTIKIENVTVSNKNYTIDIFESFVIIHCISSDEMLFVHGSGKIKLNNHHIGSFER